jgi:hypothetical protein
MKTEKTKGRRNGPPSGTFDEAAETVAHVIALARETGHRDVDSADVQWNRPWTVKEMDTGMRGQKRVRNRRALVVSRYDDHRHSGVGDALERLERAHHQSRFDAAPEEDVAAVNHEIDLTSNGRLQGELIRFEKILASTTAIRARPLGKIESEMRVGDEQGADRLSGHDGERTGASIRAAKKANVPQGNRRRGLRLVGRSAASFFAKRRNEIPQKWMRNPTWIVE